ncbi:hypothetical protein [Pseudarthrobacter sp. Y6]|uniref:sunset domain-containing protein n=1 Tax=Pseudarthrobacter sp. Y6 TaxID=3418422 RepID=UPI003CEECE6D
MDIVFWIILIVLIVGVVWWLLNRSSSSSTGDSTPVRADGGLSGGSAAASAEAAGTAGIPSAAGFGAAEPAPPTTADEAPERSSTVIHQEANTGHEASLAEVSDEKDTSIGQDARVEPDAAGSTDTAAAAAPERVSSEELSSPEESAGSEEPSSPEQRARPDGPAGHEEPALPEELTTQEPGSQESVNRQADDAEWETQWSEASAPTQLAASHRPTGEASTVIADPPLPQAPPAQDTGFVHHPEYTEPHAATLPGAETAAAEAVDAEVDAIDSARDAATTDSVQIAGSTEAAVSTGAAEPAEPATMDPAAVADYEAAPEPTGHLGADQPYGAGSASPGPDGSGPADFDVKADAGAMVYYEEGHPDYEQTKADVWFESAAHAEAAGFRAPRRTRI